MQKNDLKFNKIILNGFGNKKTDAHHNATFRIWTPQKKITTVTILLFIWDQYCINKHQSISCFISI